MCMMWHEWDYHNMFGHGLRGRRPGSACIKSIFCFFGLAAANIHLPQQNKWAVYLSFRSFRLLFLLWYHFFNIFYMFDFISNGTCLVFIQHCRKTKMYLLFRYFIFLQSSKFRFRVRPRLYRLVGENNLRALKQM